jgi:tetratricopeptide (TPR) repeat protein
MRRKDRESIPADVAAHVLFMADRTCCVCRTRGKPVQIHHIDGNPSNNQESNLAVLCFDCHTQTQVKGGFHRKLNSDQVILYRDDWIQMVAQQRAVNDVRAAISGQDREAELKSLTTTLDILKERQQFFLLAIRYEALGNPELRDKYIELAIEQDDSDENVIFLRSMQNRQDLIPKEALNREVRRRKKYADWSQLARLYSKVGNTKEAVLCYCKSVIEDIQSGRLFPAAYYLKELCEEQLENKLFALAYRQFTEENNLWWRIRALQELGWSDELKAVLTENREE